MYEAVYSGHDWRKVTAGIFLARVRFAKKYVSMMTGNYSDKDALQENADEDNRKIAMMKRFSSIFFDYEEIRG